MTTTNTNTTIDKMLSFKPDMEEVKSYFISYFQVIDLFGPVNLVALNDWACSIETNEQMLAFVLLGAYWGQKFIQSNSLQLEGELEIPAMPEPAWIHLLNTIKTSDKV
jgi:hypothetical protein